MRADQAKQIPLKDFLAQLGFEPHQEKNGELWYLSPLRQETSPSFKIARSGRAWFDHGAGQGGTIIDFAMAYFHVGSIAEALQQIAAHSHLPLFEQSSQRPARLRPAAPPARAVPTSRRQEEESPIAITKVQPLSHTALLAYLRSRGIAPYLARPYLQEAHFTNHGKPYFALAFRNESGGYELRNPYFKGSTAPKDIALIPLAADAQDSSTAIFEGFMDFLTALTLNALPEGTTVALVLNSTKMKDRAIAAIKARSGPVALFLDHDTTGRELTEYFQQAFTGRQVRDYASLYMGYNDFNALLEARQAHRR